MGVRAIVLNGRLVIDQETSLPDGTVLDLVMDDEGDGLDETNRKALNQAIKTSLDQLNRGQIRPAAEVLASLRRA